MDCLFEQIFLAIFMLACQSETHFLCLNHKLIQSVLLVLPVTILYFDVFISIFGNRTKLFYGDYKVNETLVLRTPSFTYDSLSWLVWALYILFYSFHNIKTILKRNYNFIWLNRIQIVWNKVKFQRICCAKIHYSFHKQRFSAFVYIFKFVILPLKWKSKWKGILIQLL